MDSWRYDMSDSAQAQEPVIRRADDRGSTKRDWLESYHTFAFGGYRDLDWTRWGSLRVLNEDVIAAGAGFPPHDHENMEIITYPISGAVEHEDSSGGGGIIRSGQVQRMSAGSGITHSEANASDTEPLHLLQIWVEPVRSGMEPSYETVTLSEPDTVMDQLDRIGGPDPSENAVRIHQDVHLFRGHIREGSRVRTDLQENRLGWLQVISGEVHLEAHALSASDGAGLYGPGTVDLEAEDDAHVLFFELNDVT